MRIAVLLKDRCQSKRCNTECIKYCPKVRTGDETIRIEPKGKPVIAEELCEGCGICVHKCPFEAIKIIGLPEELKDELIHQYGRNGFRLYRLPCPRKGMVTGLLGPNGIGKTTAILILAGLLVPNFGAWDRKLGLAAAVEHFRGTELHDYFVRLSERRLKTAFKPQYVDMVAKIYRGRLQTLLEETDETARFDKVVSELGMTNFLDHNIDTLSGGELQSAAIAATMLKDADIYFFDEPSSYLDITQRLKVAEAIRNLAAEKHVVVIEHDLAILDFLADNVHILYGIEGAYGVVCHPQAVRNAINTYLEGYIRTENIRFRDRPIRFDVRPERTEWHGKTLIHFGSLEKCYDGFKLRTEAGEMRSGEVVGIVGPNSIGKTTFVKLLAGEEKPTKGVVDIPITISYKPQYISFAFDGCVRELFQNAGTQLDDPFFKAEIEQPLNLKYLMEKNVSTLSGGELQCVAIGLTLARDAELYLIDEPSAYLDSNQRMETAKTIRRVIEKRGKSALIVDHDVYFIDLISDALMVFTGEPGREGKGEGPFPMRVGMNRFLAAIGRTFRRDTDTHRPRINKLDSVMDREQKERGEYYYA